MNEYETVMIIKPDVNYIPKVIYKFINLINANGAVIRVEDIGIKKLAYSIKKNTQGYYAVIKFEARPEFIQELERVYKITDEVIKFITVKTESESD